MERVMIQADKALLDRARRTARVRGVTFPQLVRDAIEHELGPTDEERLALPLTCVGAFRSERGDLSRRAGEDEYEPEPFR
ncbi:MAG TPA: hypothetical protein VGG98_06525 [Solirubrobacteraceae bacterium]